MTDKRMTDERLAQIDRCYRSAPAAQKCLLLYRHVGELLHALKAERDRVNFLWEKIKSFAAQCKKHKNRIEELEVAHASGRWNWEETDFGLAVCRGYHERGEKCEWEYMYRAETYLELQRKYDALACAVQRARDMNELRTLLKQEARDE